MPDIWKQEGGQRLFIHNRCGWSRLLIGLPFLFFGAWFYYRYLVLSVLEYVKAGDWAGLFGNPLGWLVILFMGGAFLVPGWLLVFFRRAMVLDRAAGVALELKDFRIFRRATRHPLDPFHLVLLLHEQVKNTRAARWQECVYLVRRDESMLLLGIFEDEAAAGALADAAAGMLNLPRATHDQSAWQNR